MWPLVAEGYRGTKADAKNHKNETFTVMPTIQNHGLISWINFIWRKQEPKTKCVTSVFGKASRGYFLIWHPVLPKPTDSPLSGNTHILSVSFGGSSRRKECPWQKSLCVRVTVDQDPKRGSPEKWLRDNFWARNILISLLLPPYTCLKMHSGSCVWGGPNRELLCLRKDTSHRPQGTTLRNGSPVRLSHSNSQDGKAGSNGGGGGGAHTCLDNFLHWQNSTP